MPRIKLYNATRHSAGMRWLNRKKADATLVARLLRHNSLRQIEAYARHNLDVMRDVVGGHSVRCGSKGTTNNFLAYILCKLFESEG